MSRDSYQAVHQLLRSQDYTRKPSSDGKHYYESNVIVNGKLFGIEISFQKLDFIHLPKIQVTRWPEGIPKQLPHVNPAGDLCYLDHEYLYLDRYNPTASFFTILSSLNNLLLLYVNQDSSLMEHEFSDEFSAYWNGDAFVFMRCWNEHDAYLSFFKRKPPLSEEKSHLEGVVHESQQQAQHWISKRNGIEEEKARSSIKTIMVKLQKPSVIPINRAWPPKSTKDLLFWLRAVDHGAAESLAARLGMLLSKKQSAFIVISSSSGHVGVLVRFNRLLTDKLKRNMLGKTPKKVKKEKQQSPYKILTSNLASSNEEFTRFDVIDTSDSRIASRNQPSEFSLVGKKIAIIGCGTVGSYAALLLSQIGAGVIDSKKRGCLDLFDSDLLEADNLGRHILDINYVHENKALATAHYLSNHCHSESKNFCGFPKEVFPEEISSFTKYDIVLDLTGNEEFSTAFNHYIHQSDHKITVLYAWILMGGKGVRALLDDFSGACYRCLRVERPDGLGERFNFLPKNDKAPLPITRQCGSSYFPYASGASAACATLVQQLVIDAFSDKPSPHFRHLSLTDGIQNSKHSNPGKIKECPCCSSIM